MVVEGVERRRREEVGIADVMYRAHDHCEHRGERYVVPESVSRKGCPSKVNPARSFWQTKGVPLRSDKSLR
jgi:hypothetical protein